MSDFGNQSPIQEPSKRRPRKQRSPEPSERKRKRQLPLEQYDPDDRTKIILTMITVGLVGMLVFLVLLGALDVMNIFANIIVSLMSAIAVVLSTRETVLRRFQAAQTIETKLQASRVTERFAARYAKRNPGDHEVKWLLPGDLRNLYYDKRHHAIFLSDIFKEMFIRNYEGRHRLRRAFRNMGITMITVIVATVIITLWPLGIRTGSGILIAVSTGAGLVIVYVLVGLWYCLRHIRMVVTRRITGEIWDTLPWIRSKQAFIFTHTITEPHSEQGFWGKMLGYSDHFIDTTELHPKITEWRKARSGQQLDYAFNVFAKKPEQTD